MLGIVRRNERGRRSSGWQNGLKGYVGLVFCLAIWSACIELFPIDVCERTLAAEIVVNQLADGAQSVNHPRAVVALPSGGSMTYFSSAADARPERHEVRASLLDPDGQPISRPCDDTRNDATLLAPDSSELFDLYLAPGAVAPLADDASGFLHTIRWTGSGDYATDGGSQLVGRSLDERGCPEAEVEPTVVGDEPGRFILHHVGVNMGPSELTGMGRVALFWIACDNDFLGSCDFRGRALELMFPQPRFLGVSEPATGELAPDGRAVQIVPGDAHLISGLSATVTSEGILLAWIRMPPGPIGIPRVLVETMLLDETFRVLRGIDIVYQRDDLLESLAFPQTDLVFEPESETTLVLFPDRDSEGINRRYGLLLGADGLPRPGATRFRTAFGFGEEESSSAVALPGEGFFVAVEKEDFMGTGIVGLAIDIDGAATFLNPVCDATTFQINEVNQGRQELPSVARLTSGSLQVVWSDNSESFGDPSGSAVRGRLLGSYDLFPVEE